MTLRGLNGWARSGLSGLVLVLLGGLVASAAYVRVHHAPRDQQAGFSYDDLVGFYHGIERPAPLATALERDHPEGLDPAARATLVAWLAGDRVSGDYDNLDLGDASPAEILERNCVDCHARNAADELAAALPLEYWDDVEALARSVAVAPLPIDILLVTTHTHALSLATLGLAACALGLLTRFPRGLTGALVAGCGLGLALDLAGWWLARAHEGFVVAIVAGGGLFALSAALLLVLTWIDLWWPVKGVSAPQPADRV